MNKSAFLICLLFIFELSGTSLSIQEKKITVNGKEATVLSIVQPDGTLGLRLKKGDQFDTTLHNTMQVPTSIHWHGLILPNTQDGVAFVTQYAQYPGTQYHYQFPLVQTGTYWMHSHFGLQEQLQLSAPLIIDGDEKFADKEAVLFLADFSFKSPSEIYQQLKAPKKMTMDKPDIVEVDYDAYLTNYRTLDNPDSLKVNPGDKVRLRIINGASATNFFIELGELKGEAIAVDGNLIQPLAGTKFELAVAQRIDIVVTIPKEGGICPILAQGEGTDKQTGFILTTSDQSTLKWTNTAAKKAGALTNKQEAELHALNPLPQKPVDNHILIELGGNMSGYVWTLNGQSWPEVTPPIVQKGQRVEITFKNVTSMSHPMHLHGHVFKFTEIDGKPIQGAMRDTVLVMPNSSISIQFDANNPGVWPLHCHILYHLEAGMFTVLRYNDYLQAL